MAGARTARVALVQTRTGRDIARNMADLEAAIREAHGRGARYVQTPENSNIMELERERLFAAVRPETDAPEIHRCRTLARELGIWLHLGSMAVKVAADKLANRSLLIAPDGAIAARYDKIHMFDVDLPGGESYRESRNFQPGGEAVTAEMPMGRLGLTVCYDVRFPSLYRALAQAGAEMLAVPSAFTRQTGEAHWHVLLRARAIETGAFVLAAAQSGRHENGRETYGHSLVVAPWGEVLVDGGTEPGVFEADIDLRLVNNSRSRIPVLHHDRSFLISPTGGPGVGIAS